MSWNSGAKCLRMDDATPTVSYFGYATPGTSDTDPSWRIMRMTTSGTQTSIAYAGGNTDFDSVWADRLILSYA